LVEDGQAQAQVLLWVLQYVQVSALQLVVSLGESEVV
jgi:hypothetical protein